MSTGHWLASAAGAGGGGWVELGRTTLGSDGDLVSVGSLDDKRYYMVLADVLPDTSSPNVDYFFTVNGDTGSNYAWRGSQNSASDSPQTSNPNGVGCARSHLNNSTFLVGYWANLAANDKLFIAHSCQGSTAGAGTVPTRRETVGKWGNTSNVISTLAMKNTTGSDSYKSGSEVVVLGYDPDDTHTTNFWEELASVSNTTTQDTNTTGSFTAKKYLWVQMYVKATGVANTNIYFNNSKTGADYAFRESADGGTDYEGASSNTATTGTITNNTSRFINMFINNDGSHEPLVIYDHVDQSTAGAGTAPSRKEVVFKSDVVTQLTSIGLDNSGGGSYTAFECKVWGSD
jgi:hypothetical protein